MASFPIYHRDDYWKIWYKVYEDGIYRCAGVWWQDYKHKSSAVRRAKKQFGEPRIDSDGRVTSYEWFVSKTNPFGWKENK